MDGYLVVDNIVVGEVHGYSGSPLPAGQTFIPASIPGVVVGASAPSVHNQRLKQLAARRYEAEISGVLIGSVRYHTDRESQFLMTTAIRMLEERELRGETNPKTVWKTMNAGFVTVDLDGLINVGLALGRHVEACFAHEAQLAAQIVVANDPYSIDINSGWPGA